jgi:hypothetical protein
MQQPPTQQQSGATNGAVGELRADAQQIGSKAAERLHDELDARKGTAATQAKSVSNAIQSAAGQLDDSAPAWLRSAFQQGADQIQRFAETLEQKDSKQILHEVHRFARERPGLFLGACAAAGFAAARVFKAGGEPQSNQQFRTTEWDRSRTRDNGGSDYGQGDSFGQSFDEGGQGRPFIAAGDSAGQSTSQKSAGRRPAPPADDPSILARGGAGGSELPGRGDNR